MKKFFYMCIISINILYTINAFTTIKPNYTLTPENVVAEIVALYKETANAHYIGEAISQLDHALQTAQQALYAFDKTNDINEENIIAALLHDIGHRYTGNNAQHMNEFGVKHHDTIGAEFLKARGFSDKVVTLVGGHVQAKRYKVFKNNNYYDQLTYASKQTLNFQGGAMTQEEAAAFEKTPYAQQVVLLRTWEEKAKVANAETPPFSYFESLLLEHLKKNLIAK